MALSRAVAREVAQQMAMAQNMPIPKTELEQSEGIIGEFFLTYLLFNHLRKKKRNAEIITRADRKLFTIPNYNIFGTQRP